MVSLPVPLPFFLARSYAGTDTHGEPFAGKPVFPLLHSNIAILKMNFVKADEGGAT